MKKLISLGVSIAILVLLYQFLDREILFKTLSQSDLELLGYSILFLVVLIFLSGFRLQLLGDKSGFHISARQAVEATFVANALNMFLPGKLGDVLKSSVLADDRPDKLKFAVLLAVWEKVADLTMLFVLAAISFGYVADYVGMSIMLLLSLAGLTVLLLGDLVHTIVKNIMPSLLEKNQLLRETLATWCELQATLKKRSGGLLILFGITFIIWLGHLLQIGLMLGALGVSGTSQYWANIIGYIPIAIVAGLVPLTFAGVGTRDAALVILLGATIGVETAAALGVLFWLRYLVPGLLGVPLLPKFFRTAMSHSKRVIRSRKRV